MLLMKMLLMKMLRVQDIEMWSVDREASVAVAEGGGFESEDVVGSVAILPESPRFFHSVSTHASS